MKKLVLLFILFLGSSAFGCTSVSAPYTLNMAIDPMNSNMYFYNETRMIWDRPDISLESCSLTAQRDQYVMFAVALENFILSDDFLTYSINDQISGSGEQCHIENNYFQNVQESSERRKRLLDKRNFVNRCLKFSITDFSRSGIDITDNQPGCTVIRKSNHSVDFIGPYCFVKPKIDSSIAFSVDVAQECRDLDFYKENKLILQDVLGVLSIYTAGDQTGFSPDLTSIKQTNLRISVNSPENLLATNSYTGDKKPTWPTSWNMPNIYLGEPSVNLKSSSFDEFEFPLLVDNRCERKCIDNVCTSSCDYSQPVVGDFALFEVNKGRKELLTSWFDGGVAPAQWQGLLKGVGVKIPKNIIELNKKYILEIDLSDQELNYLSFKGRIEKMLKMNNVIGEMNREGSRIREIPQINMVGELSRLPSIRNINGISFTGNGFLGVQEALRSVQLTFKNSFWPPYFEKTCFNGKCVKQASMKNKIIMKFELTGDLKNAKFSNVSFSRNSNIVNNESFSNYAFPKVNCGIDNSDEDDAGLGDFDF